MSSFEHRGGHAPQAAQRQGRIAELQVRAQALSDKLDAQDEGQRSRGRALSDAGAKARFFHEVAQAHLATIVKVDLKSDLFAYEIDDEALARAELMDGKLLRVTNVTSMTPAEVVARYKSLADIERGFRVRPRRRWSNCAASSATACASTTARPSVACPPSTPIRPCCWPH